MNPCLMRQMIETINIFQVLLRFLLLSTCVSFFQKFEWQRVKLANYCLGTHPRYSPVADENIKLTFKQTNQKSNTHTVISWAKLVDQSIKQPLDRSNIQSIISINKSVRQSTNQHNYNKFNQQANQPVTEPRNQPIN